MTTVVCKNATKRVKKGANINYENAKKEKFCFSTFGM